MELDQTLLDRIASNDPTLGILWIDNEISNEGALDLAEALKANKTITELCLSHNKIGDLGMQALCQTLTTNHTIARLFLNNQEFGDEGIESLQHLLISNNTITSLDISCNKINNKQITVLAKALESNKTIKKLDILGNEIGNEGANALISTLKTNKIITEIVIRGNLIETQELGRLREAIMQNRGIKITLPDTTLWIQEEALRKQQLEEEKVKKEIALSILKAKYPCLISRGDDSTDTEQLIQKVSKIEALVDKIMKSAFEELLHNQDNMAAAHNVEMDDVLGDV